MAEPPLELPERLSARLLTNAREEEAVSSFVETSPDRTIYHHRAYVDFAREENGAGDVMLVARDGNALFALPVHPSGAGFTTGYSGIVLPAGGEAVLKRSVKALAELLEANPNVPLEVLQAVQAPAYDDPGRTTLVQQLVEVEGFAVRSLYSRVLRLSPDGSDAAVDAEALLGREMSGYDGDLRNQIRQAVRRGVSIDYSLASDADGRARAYEAFHALHERSWQRTGLEPHRLDYWLRLSAAVTDAGGSDLVVLALDPAGEPVAGVVCHVREGRAIYWGGASVDDGLRLRANPLCLHAAISVCESLGATLFELGRFSPREPAEKERAITAYKAQFGGELVRVTAFGTPRTARQRARGAARRALSSLSRRG